jgi:hypothetical protein
LSGEQCSVPSILAASLVSLFVTAYMPFIHTQHSRADLDESIFHDFELDGHGRALGESAAKEDGAESTDDTETTAVDTFTPMSEIRKSPSCSGTEGEASDPTRPLIAVVV